MLHTLPPDVFVDIFVLLVGDTRIDSNGRDGIALLQVSTLTRALRERCVRGLAAAIALDLSTMKQRCDEESSFFPWVTEIIHTFGSSFASDIVDNVDAMVALPEAKPKVIVDAAAAMTPRHVGPQTIADRAECMLIRLAAFYRRPAIVTRIMEKGLPRCCGMNLTHPVRLAARVGDVDMLKLLIHRFHVKHTRWNVSGRWDADECAIVTAVRAGHVDAVVMLLGERDPSRAASFESSASRCTLLTALKTSMPEVLLALTAVGCGL